MAVSGESIMWILCLILYIDLMAYMYVKVFYQNGIKIRGGELVSRYKCLDDNIKRRIRGFLALLIIQYLILLAGNTGVFVLGLFFMPIILAMVVLIVYQYSYVCD